MHVISGPVDWLGNPKTAIFAIIAILITTSVGQPIILYVAALGNVPKDLIEASEIDGANKWQAFKNVTWPLIMPTTLYIVVVTTINSFQIFALIQLLTHGGPKLYNFHYNVSCLSDSNSRRKIWSIIGNGNYPCDNNWNNFNITV